MNTATAPKFDDVLLAMDIVDTLRHRERVVSKALDGAAREEELLARLREIYEGQGIEVPDHILRDGVKALEEQRFVYKPPESGFMTGLARLYVTRDRWGKPVGILTGLIALIFAAWMGFVELPRQAEARQARIELTQTLPTELDRLREAALSVAETDPVRNRIISLHEDGVNAIAEQDAGRARSAATRLRDLNETLRQSFAVRIVSRPGEYSGVFRIPEDNPGTRNYYLIVEAVDDNGNLVATQITSEEDQRTKMTQIWGVRVPEAVFDAVAADKQDDQIIQNAIIGRKPRGVLDIDYTINGAGGAILEW